VSRIDADLFNRVTRNMKDTDEYLIAQVGGIQLGIYCRDVKNVYSQNMKLVRLFYQDQIFRGIARINGQIMQIIDLRRRINMDAESESECLTVISFQTEMAKTIAMVVDHIDGMKTIRQEQLCSQNANLNNARDNINLLFPMVAVMEDGRLIHLLDSTYLDKLEPISEEAGDLEFF